MSHSVEHKPKKINIPTVAAPAITEFGPLYTVRALETVFGTIRYTGTIFTRGNRDVFFTSSIPPYVRFPNQEGLYTAARFYLLEDLNVNDLPTLLRQVVAIQAAQEDPDWNGSAKSRQQNYQAMLGYLQTFTNACYLTEPVLTEVHKAITEWCDTSYL